MKGTFFQRPLEYKLLVDGESWAQGDLISGTLQVTNHGPEAALDDARVDLAHGLMRKVQQKAAGAFKIAESAKVSFGTLAPGTTASREWKFQTDKNCPITDNLSSLFLLYGRGQTTEQLGHLQLIVSPHSLMREFVSHFQIQFRFILKSWKHSKGQAEVKLLPPSSKAYTMLEHVTLGFRFDGDVLEAQYEFHGKKIDALHAGLDIVKNKKKLTQTIDRSQYLSSSGRVNHDFIESRIQEALGQVDGKILAQ